ncbi:hypothetical protein PA25_33000 [Pseudoalteromonas sp. A25]|uniref:hypothetical protein n=1 Tax=Pseudoalteromonas sp. A25 TaxID=116092 RepID=UPI001260A547|nr:hypothetical protein [Pseudoalteromonas sp. A25]BBN83315.1 hypothetical protein PA25_33000 [Pseudoalteromonas sp. A25]
MRKLIVALSMVSAFCANAASVDRGKITEIYTDNVGHVGLKIDTGYVDAQRNGECHSNNGWAGLYDPHPNLLSTIYHAHQTGADVTVVTEGCEGATWIRLKSLYLKTTSN